jgi:ABC-type transport system involved in multi-copper enzyme maturation permease subunit
MVLKAFFIIMAIVVFLVFLIALYDIFGKPFGCDTTLTNSLFDRLNCSFWCRVLILAIGLMTIGFLAWVASTRKG